MTSLGDNDSKPLLSDIPKNSNEVTCSNVGCKFKTNASWKLTIHSLMCEYKLMICGKCGKKYISADVPYHEFRDSYKCKYHKTSHYVTKCELDKHYEKIYKGKVLECSKCVARFRTVEERSTHYDNEHRFKCTFCTKYHDKLDEQGYSIYHAIVGDMKDYFDKLHKEIEILRGEIKELKCTK